MITKKEIIRFVMLLFIFSVISIAFLNQNHKLKGKNEVIKKENLILKNDALNLKNKISTLEENIKKINLEQYNSNTNALAINYTDITDKVRFIEKKTQILQLPKNGSIAMRTIYSNTLVKVCKKALVNGEAWLFVEVPTNDSPVNSIGWIKESDSTPYTKDKVQLVQNIEIKAGSECYETEEFENIKTTTPKVFEIQISGRLILKKDGYCKINQADALILWVKESSIIYPEVK